MSAATSALDFVVRWTIWPDLPGKSQDRPQATLRYLSDQFREVSKVTVKDNLPLFSGVLFGDLIADPETGCMRTVENVLGFNAVTVDYDGEELGWLAFAMAACQRERVAAVFYESASHTDYAPRYRVVFPCAELHDAADYARLVARIDGGLFDCTLAKESYTVARGYFYRGLAHKPAPNVFLVDGGPIDWADHLAHVEGDTLASQHTKTADELEPAALAEDTDLELDDATQEALLERMIHKRLVGAPDGHKHRILFKVARHVGGIMRKLGYTADQLSDLMIDKLRMASSAMASEADARKTALDGLRAGAKKPLAIAPVLSAYSLGPAFSGANIHIEPQPVSPPPPLTHAQRAAAERYNAFVLRDAVFPPTRWIVNNYIPEGLLILAAAPKFGKSWLLLQLSIARSNGSGMTVLGEPINEAGDVLYLALEDNRKRMQDRIGKLLAGDKTQWPERLTMWHRISPLDKGGLEEIAAWLDEHPGGVVLIDTLQKIRGRKQKGESDYEADYRAVGCLQTLASERRTTIIIAHHVTKQKSGDVMEMVSGTFGVTGAADATIVMDKPDNGKRLTLTGRDVETLEKAIEFNKATFQWRVRGNYEDAPPVLSGTAQKIVDYLTQCGEPQSPTEVAAFLNLNQTTATNTLNRLAMKDVLVRMGRGKYQAVPPPPPPANDDLEASYAPPFHLNKN